MAVPFLRNRLYACILAICATFCSLVPAGAQNLVPNGGFDQTNGNVPQGITELTDELLRCGTGWKRTTGGSSDYFHLRGNYPAYAPNTGFGYQAPRSDSGFAGVLIIHDNRTTYPNPGIQHREYISRQLAAPLQAGHTYQVSFWVARAEQPDFTSTSGTISRIGAYMSTNAVVFSGSTPLSHLTPQVASNSLLDSDDWQQITGTFTAAGGEEHITIGNFESQLVNSETRKRAPYTAPPYGPPVNFALTAYYFIDDVEITDITPCVCDNAYSVIVTPVASTAGSCCYDIEVRKNTSLACDLWGVYITLPDGSRGDVGIFGGPNPLLVTMQDVIELHNVCLPAFTGQQDITIEFLGEHAYDGPDPFDPAALCTKTIQLAGCKTSCCQDAYTVEYVPLPGSSNADRCCYTARIRKAYANACDLYGATFDLPGNPAGAFSTWNATPSLQTMQDVLEFEVCMPAFSGQRLTTVHFLGAGEETMCSTTASIAGCNGPQCCDGAFMVTVEPVTGASATSCCYNVRIKKARPDACAVYGAVLDLPVAYTGNNALLSPTPLLVAMQDEIVLGPFCLEMPDETLDITLRLLDESSAVPEALADPSLFGCRRTITLTACESPCCENIEAMLFAEPGPAGNCCWNLYILQDLTPGCEVYSAVIKDNGMYIGTMANTDGSPLHFASPNDQFMAPVWFLCKNLGGLSGVSGAYTVTFLDANGDTLCEKRLPYSCGNPPDDNDEDPILDKQSSNSTETQRSSLLSVHPNPAVDVVVISVGPEAGVHARLEICDAFGRVVDTVADPHRSGIGSFQYDTSRLAAGLYLVRLVAPGTTATIPLTIVR